MRKLRLLFFVGLALVAMGIGWSRYASRAVEPGQPPLVTLDGASLSAVRADFNESAGMPRAIVLLSPT